LDSYYSPQDLPRMGEIGEHAQSLYQDFDRWYNNVLAEGALPKKTKHLIAMAVAHALQCPYCIDAHTVGSKNAGASMEEITEALHVAAAIRGGAALVHGVQSLNALERE